MCDFCAPDDCIAQSFRPATDAERKAAGRILGALKKAGRKATGRLHSEVFADYSLDRDGFEQVLGAMARAGWVEMSDASFQQDGRRVDYRLAGLSAAGRRLDESAAVPAFEMKLEIEATPASAARKRAPPNRASGRRPPRRPPMREWRRRCATGGWPKPGAARCPPSGSCPTKSLQAIATDKPASIRELLEIPGIGARLAEQYGAQIFQILSHQ